MPVNAHEDRGADGSEPAPERAGNRPLHPVDRVTVHALRAALRASPAREPVVGQLVALANGNRAALARALKRLYVRSEGHPVSATAVRAAILVRAALERADEGPQDGMP
jgi:hypothetical protein